MALESLTVVAQSGISQVGAVAQMEGSAAMFMTPIIKYKDKITKDTQITADAPSAVMFIDRDMMIDIEDGVTLTIDDGCSFTISDL